MPFADVEVRLAFLVVVGGIRQRCFGRSFAELGDLEAAAEQFEAARTLYLRISGPTHTDTLASMDNLATCFRRLSKHAEALLLHEETLASLKTFLASSMASWVFTSSSL